MKLIDKDKITAEIERRIKELKNCHADTVAGYAGEISGLKRLLSFIDTLEVKKDVYLEKEVDVQDAIHGTIDYPLIGCDFPNIYPNYKEFKEYCDRKAIKDNDKVKLIIIKDM